MCDHGLKYDHFVVLFIKLIFDIEKTLTSIKNIGSWLCIINNCSIAWSNVKLCLLLLTIKSREELSRWGICSERGEKKALARVLTREYTSSDESDLFEDEEGHQFVKAFLIKKLPWERTVELHRAHLNMNPSTRCKRLDRKVHPEPSTRPLPSDVLHWAVTTTWGLVSKWLFNTPI